MTAIDAAAVRARPNKMSIETKVLLTVLLGLAAWGAAIFTFGIPGLYIPAVALVPVMFTLLILITQG